MKLTGIVVKPERQKIAGKWNTKREKKIIIIEICYQHSKCWANRAIIFIAFYALAIVSFHSSIQKLFRIPRQ